MNGLKAEFGDQVEFIDLNIDDPSLDSIREEYEITGRTQYVFIDAEGNVVRRWFGPLTSEAMTAQLRELLATSN